MSSRAQRVSGLPSEGSLFLTPQQLSPGSDQPVNPHSKPSPAKREAGMLSGELSRSPTPSKSKGFLPLPTSTLAPATCTGQDPKNMPGHSSNLGPTWDRTAQPTPESTTRVNKKTRPWLDPQSPPASQCTEPLGPQDPTGTRARDSPSPDSPGACTATGPLWST